MSRTLSSTALESTQAEDTDEVWLVLVTIEQADLTEPIRVVNNNEDITSGGDLFVAYAFEVELPGEQADTPGQGRLKIDNTDKVIVEAVRSINGVPTVTLEVVLASDPDTIEISYTGLRMRNIGYDVGFVTGDLVFDDVLTEPVSVDITPSRFPGMF